MENGKSITLKMANPQPLRASTVSKQPRRARQIAEIIRHIRVQLNMTQQELGDMLEVSGATVCNWESGICEPRPRTLNLLAEKVGCEIEVRMVPLSEIKK